MKFVSFIILLFRHGRFHQSFHDFNNERRAVLCELNIELPKENSKSFTQALLNPLMKKSWTRAIVSNLALLKNSRRANIMLFPVHEKKLVYIRILKSASTSVLKELLPHINPKLKGVLLSDRQIDALAMYYAQFSFSKNSTYTKFALVRNPFARIVSVYLDILNPENSHSFYENYWFGILEKGLDFKEFIRRVSTIPVSLLGPHLIPQAEIIIQAGGKEKVACYRIEKDKERLDEFLLYHGISLPHRNMQIKKYDYRSFYDHETLSKVYTLYKKDVAFFGYQDEHSALAELIKLRKT